MQKAQTKSKSGRKSKNKKSETPKREDEIKRKAELEAKIRRRVSLEEKAFRIVEQLLENPITEEFLITAAQSIDPNHYADVVEERAIIKHCGYPLCTKPLTDVPKQKYHISTKTNRVYDITERKNFCSGQCYKASKYFEKQLSATPVWLRDDEPPVTIQLLNIASNKGSLGEVVFISPRSELKEELDKLESTDAEFVGKKPPTGQQVNTGSEGRDLDDRRQGRPAPDVSEKRTEPAADSSGDVKKQRETAFTDGGDEDSREDSDTKRADPVTFDPPSDSLLLEDVARDMSGLCLERSLDNLRRLHATDLGEEEEEEEVSSPGSDRIRKEGGPVPQPDSGQAGIRPGSESSDRPADLMEPLSIGIPPTDLFDLGQPGGQPGATADPGVWIPGDGGSGRTTSVPDLAPGNSKDVAARVERGSGRRPGSPLSAGSDPEAGQNGIRTLVTAPNAAAAKSRAIREMPKRYEPNRDAGPGSEKETPASQEPAVGDRGVKAKAVAESTALAKARVLSELLDRRDALLRIQEAKHRQDKAVATPSGGQASSRSLGLLQLIEDCTADPDEGQSGGDAKSSSEDRSDPDVGPRSAGQLDPDASKRDPAGRPSGPNRRASAKTAARILANIRRASEQRKRLPDVSAPRSPPGGRGGRRTAAGGKEAKAPRAVVLELIRRTLLDWKTAETARFLTGRRTPTADGPRYGQYAAYNRMFVGREYSGLVGDELDDDDDDDGGGGGGPRGKLPDISRLRADQIYAARVMEFYGLTSREKSARRQTDSDQREEGGTDRVADEEVFLPLVDSHSQMSHRRKIVLDKLGKVFPDLLGPLKVPVSEVSTELRTLVHTFNLTSTNIVLKPAEWTLIAYFLLHLLTLCCPDLRRSMQTEVATHYFKTMLLSVNITSSDVQAITDMMSSLP